MTRTIPRAAAARAILDQATPYPAPLVILLDGGSGAGKTVLADDIARAWRQARHDSLQVVHLDDVYPGWYGLDAASRAVVDTILDPDRPGYRRWDWETNQPAAWVDLDPHCSTLIEGCGALTPASAAVSPVRVWVELDEAVRKTRALARDEGYEPWWDIWAAQEAEHWRNHRPWELATLRVLG